METQNKTYSETLCPNCACHPRLNARFCTSCGFKLPQEPVKFVAPEQPTSDPFATFVMDDDGSDVRDAIRALRGDFDQIPCDLSDYLVQEPDNVKRYEVKYDNARYELMTGVSSSYAINWAIDRLAIGNHAQIDVIDTNTGETVWSRAPHSAQTPGILTVQNGYELAPIGAYDPYTLQCARLTNDGGVKLTLTLRQWLAVANIRVYGSTLNRAASKLVSQWLYDGLGSQDPVDYSFRLPLEITLSQWQRILTMNERYSHFNLD